MCKEKIISAVIVTFEPDLDILTHLYNIIAAQTNTVYIIDNSERFNILDFENRFPNAALMHMGGNIGIAAAQNIAAHRAFTDGADEILFLDQDSIPSQDMVKNLLLTRMLAENNGVKVAAVGPTYYDHRTKTYNNFIRTHPCSVKKIQYDISKKYCIASFIISSGMLVRKDAWLLIGPNIDELFIDCVDIEWGFRAAKHNLECIGSFIATSVHTVGDEHISLMKKKFTYHAPIRHYYFFRNIYFLLRKNYIPLYWKLYVISRSFVQLIVFTFFGRERGAHFCMITKGIRDGLSGKLGKFDG